MFLSKSLSFNLGIRPDKGGALQLWAGLKQRLLCLFELRRREHKVRNESLLATGYMIPPLELVESGKFLGRQTSKK